MSSVDGPDEGCDRIAGNGREAPAARLDTQLVDALMHHLIEKGVLTRNDALSVVQTVVQVQLGRLHEGREDAVTHDALGVLRRMYASFEAVADRAGTVQADGENIRRLRPPIHDDRPELPVDE